MQTWRQALQAPERFLGGSQIGLSFSGGFVVWARMTWGGWDGEGTDATWEQ